MITKMGEEVKLWIAKRKSALVLEIQGKMTVAHKREQRMRFAPSEVDAWANDGKRGMENALPVQGTTQHSAWDASSPLDYQRGLQVTDYLDLFKSVKVDTTENTSIENDATEQLKFSASVYSTSAMTFCTCP